MPPRILPGVSGAELILVERLRQLSDYPPVHDDEHGRQEMARAASYYAFPIQAPGPVQLEGCFLTGLPKALAFAFPWKEGTQQLTPAKAALGFTPAYFELRVAELTKAGALCAAEIDRLLRLQAARGGD